MLRTLPGLGVLAKIDGQYFTSSILFESTEDREASDKRLRDYQATAGRPFALVIESVIELPPINIPSARYDELQKLVKQTPKDPVFNAAELCESLTRKISILEVFRSHMSKTEASAFDMQNPKRLLIDFAESPGMLSWTEFVVSGPRTNPGVHLVDIANRVDAYRDPLFELKFRRDGLIGATERIEGWTIHTSMPFEVENPLVENIKLLSKRAREFNRSLDGVKVAGHVPGSGVISGC